MDQSQPTGPDTDSFLRFMQDMQQAFPDKSYRWSKAKERSCRWLIKRIASGAVGVDVGGTEYLCKQLAANGVDVTCFDMGKPLEFKKYVQDDMFNILRHFEPKSLDFITTRHTLEHSFVPLYQLWAYNQLLKDGGKLMVIVPMYNDRWVWMDTHFACLPPESWAMLFHRAGFKVTEFDAGTWKPAGAEFIEYRFCMEVESRSLRLHGRPEGAKAMPSGED